jgi:hypothetical protein
VHFSGTGAAIQLIDPTIPDAFQYLIKPEMVKRTRKVVWRSETTLACGAADQPEISNESRQLGHVLQYRETP